jgi:hypothetical protein
MTKMAAQDVIRCWQLEQQLGPSSAVAAGTVGALGAAAACRLDSSPFHHTRPQVLLYSLTKLMHANWDHTGLQGCEPYLLRL